MAAVRQLARLLAARAASCGALALLTLGPAPAAWSEQIYREDAVKAAFLYRFTGYVDWPESALATPAFTIAMLDARGVARELDRILPAHRIKGLPARTREISSWRDVGDAQVVFIGQGYQGDLHQVAHRLGDKAVLIVTDHAQGLESGGAVNFLIVDRRVRFEVSVTAAERAGLKIGSELLSVAARVRGAAHWDACEAVQRARSRRACGARTAGL